jgi:predicted GNAT family acetyltransferase
LAAVARPEALKDLPSLLEPGESVWLVGNQYQPVPGLMFEGTLECFQMILPNSVTPPEPSVDAERLSDGDEMLALTDIEFPGFFRRRTCEMGSYYGVRSQGALIAMGGERLIVDNFAEISGVCTRKEHRGKGLASSLIWRLVRDHRRDGMVSWLHVGLENRRAMELYSSMGFEVYQKVALHRVCATG